AVALAEALQVVDRQGKFALADTIRRAFEVGEVVARHLLVGADEKMRELPAAGAGLGEELRDRRLQDVLRKQEGRLERHLRGPRGGDGGRRQLEVCAFVEEPLR